MVMQVTGVNRHHGSALPSWAPASLNLGLPTLDSPGGAEGGLGWGDSLPVVVAQPQIKDPLGAELLQPLIHVLAHGIEVLVGLVPEGKHLCV